MSYPSPIKILLICVVFLTKMTVEGYAQKFHEDTGNSITIPYPTVSTSSSFRIDITGTKTTESLTFGFLTQAIDPNNIADYKAFWYVLNDPTKDPTYNMDSPAGTVNTANEVHVENSGIFTLPQTPNSEYSNFPWYSASVSNDGCAGEFFSKWVQIKIPVTLCPKDIESAKYNSSNQKIEMFPSSEYTYYTCDAGKNISTELNTEIAEYFTKALWGGAGIPTYLNIFSFIGITKSDGTNLTNKVHPEDNTKQIYAFELNKTYYLNFGTIEKSDGGGDLLIKKDIPLLQIELTFENRPQMVQNSASIVSP